MPRTHLSGHALPDVEFMIGGWAFPRPKGFPLPTSPPVVSQSQRDSVSKPRIGSSELPWVNWTRRRQPQRGCGLQSSLEAATPLGLDAFWTPFSQGSSLLATLGWRTQSLWDSSARRCDLWGMLSLKGEGKGEGEEGMLPPHASPNCWRCRTSTPIRRLCRAQVFPFPSPQPSPLGRGRTIAFPS